MTEINLIEGKEGQNKKIKYTYMKELKRLTIALHAFEYT